MRLWKTCAMVPLLALPLAAGPVITLPAAASVNAASCAEFSFTNPYLGAALRIPSVILSEGSTGPCVALLQRELNGVIGARLAVDSDFGPKTFAAVKTFQGDYIGCTRTVDGIAGPYTMSCLDAAGSG